MKTTKLLLIALVFVAMAGSSAIAQTKTASTIARPSITSSRTMTANHWNHHRYYRPRSNVYFDFGFGYPYYGYGWGYPYYGAYPYGYGYYTPRYTVYERGFTDDATVAAVQ